MVQRAEFEKTRADKLEAELKDLQTHFDRQKSELDELNKRMADQVGLGLSLIL